MSEVNTELLTAPYVLEYTYTRSTGPVIGRFLTSLRDGKIEGIRTKTGKVLVPPTEYDPETGDSLDEFVTLEGKGTVKTWCWVDQPKPAQPLDKPFAWALILLDGADSAMLHAVDVPNIEAMKTGMRVQVRWAEQRLGCIQDIACFVPLEGS